MKDYHINIFYSNQDEGYIADIPDLKYCSAFGETPESALQEVQIAKTAWLEAATSCGKTHSRTKISTCNISTYDLKNIAHPPYCIRSIVRYCTASPT